MIRRTANRAMPRDDGIDISGWGFRSMPVEEIVEAKRRITGRGNKQDYKAEIARLDAISRERALTDAESIMLERMLWRVEKKGTRRSPVGTLKELARVGIKRSQVRHI